MSAFLKIGHRGAKGHVTENTLQSIQKAMDFNVDGIEIDVHVCKTGELVVFHDFTLDRLTNGTGEIGKKTLSQLQNLQVEDQYTIPTLREVLQLIDNKLLINIELKGEGTAIPTCNIIQELINDKKWSLDNILVSSFQQNELVDVFNYDSNIPLGVLTKASVNQAIVFAKTINAKAIHPSFSLLSKNNVQKAKEEGLLVNAWTVNTKQAIKRIKSYQVDAIISDFPDRL
ncbi:glycerophosphodiester phosphodiesterase [Olleya aquimaris]|uniref:Glycerophosphodiester phosphodiesterase n=1 Tax=Olleya sediminilitoris TaxID=2795739 RepID=A0ABS1WJ99_9FLAO|nr:glycerophosphodiester phosphodiesterase family protein [Olleya sediminilitoris]AXO81260.1 glycerophosphodiester phosphodiesterase [Olleya aquimaris]MBL7559183.1 glycerophosphodiester phosphodiesterase [Olleya sediminilitoris]